MALGRYSRVDGKKSSCSTATIVVVIAVCLVGVWMFMSSSAVPAQSPDLPAAKESKQKDSTKLSSQFEDNSGDLTLDDSVKDGGNQENTNSEESNTKEVERSTGDDSSSSEEKSKSEDTDSNSESNDSEKSNGSDSDSDSNESEKNNDSDSDSNESKKTDSSENEKSNDSDSDANETEKKEEKTDKDEEKKAEESSSDDKTEDLSAATQSEITKETNAQNGAFSTQAAESTNEKKSQNVYQWKTCNVTAGPDYIPCLDNLEAIKHLQGRSHYEHRERLCPADSPTCLVSLPVGYNTPIKWPRSREQVWYSNVPHTKLAVVKGHQNWVKVSGEYLTFPGGGTQFKNGALHYVDFIQNSLPDIAWGKRTRVILDVGCGVASFGGYLFERDVIAMSFAPKDEHEAQVQFALERGIPAISAVMGTKRLPFPSKIFDVVHCARCRVPWHIEGE
ncbi:hypothetical protein SSX86_007466 [Deinandra increscens subsp. villosa]|uniref:Methyltransferase n=1 Tax=Deinandra increscens subsp. villosa TaxID=3103831 RepID=A0AAP0DHJ8_9ASTR